MSSKKNKTKIGHSLQQLQDGLILTLQDKPVLLNNGQINQDDDVFENYQKRLNNEAEHNKQLKQKLKVIANAASSHLQAAKQGATGILPHYDDYTYKSDQVDLQDGSVVKRSRPKMPKNIPNDFQVHENINNQYYERGSKFKQRKKQKSNTDDLLTFLNQTAVQKQITDQPQNTQSAVDVIQQSLLTIRKRKRVQNQQIQARKNIVENEDEQLLQKAIKITRQRNRQATNLLNIIKQQAQDQDGCQKIKYTQIQMNPVNYKQRNLQKIQKTYNIVDAAKGTTSCLNVHLPSQKIIIKKEQKQLPNSFQQISQQQLQKMKQQVSFLQQKQMSVGLSGTLQFLRQKNMLNYQEQFGRTNDKQSHHNQPGDRIKLQYRNASGKLMKPKQAFRYMSAIFHGQGPGKNKIEKIKKKQLLEMRMKQAASQPGKLMNLLQKHQQKSGQAHMLIQLGSKNKQQ